MSINRHTSGRCWSCNEAWRWPEGARRRLKHAWCPKCANKLRQTTHLFQGTWHEELPVFAHTHFTAERLVRRRNR